MTDNSFFEACEKEFKNCECLAIAILNHPDCPGWLVDKIVTDYPGSDAFELAITDSKLSIDLVLGLIGKEYKTDIILASRSEQQVLYKIWENYKDLPFDDKKQNIINRLSNNREMPSDFVESLFSKSYNNRTLVGCILQMKNCTNAIRLKALEKYFNYDYIIEYTIAQNMSNDVINLIKHYSNSRFFQFSNKILDAIMARKELNNG